MKNRQIPSLKTMLLGPLLIFVLLFLPTVIYFTLSFQSKYFALRQKIDLDAQITKDILELNRIRNWSQEALLLYRVTKDTRYVERLEIWNNERIEILNKLSEHGPLLGDLHSYFIDGNREIRFLETQIIGAIQRNQFYFADRALTRFSAIYNINGARLSDLSRKVQNNLREDEKRLSWLVDRSLFFVLVLLGFTMLSFWVILAFYHKQLLGPLKTLHQGFRTLTTGNLDITLRDDHAPREIDEMIYDFNQMSAALKTSQQELTKAREQALRAAKIKSDFLSNMSHEIRTPMNAIVGMTDLLAEASLPSDISSYVRVVQDSSQLLLNIVNDILDYSRLESGHVQLDQTSFDPLLMSRRVSRVIETLAQKKNLQFKFEFAGEENIPLTGDIKRVEQILLNLLGNAVKFTDKGYVTLSVQATYTPTDCSLDFVIQDSGVGIPQESLVEIFDRFSQSDTSITRRFGGSGLGLAIVKQLVTLMDGKIHVESTLGKGSKFIVNLTLPRAALHLVENDKISSNTTTLPDHFNLLLVDDSMDNQLLILSYLKKTKCSIDTAQNGEEAFRLFQENSYDLVLMDMQMPIMDGYTATKYIRSFETQQVKPRTPIIALTAFALKEEINKSLGAGCDAHLIKPIRKNDFFVAISNHISVSPNLRQTSRPQETLNAPQ